MHRRLSLLGLATVGAAAAFAASAPAAGAPSVTKLTATPKGDAVVVKVATKNFTVSADGVGKANKRNTGHVHFSMDGGKYDHPRYSGANGKLAKQLGVQGKYSPSVNNRVTYRNLPEGAHKVTVFLVRNDHSNYPGKRAKRTIRFTVG